MAPDPIAASPPPSQNDDEAPPHRGLRRGPPAGHNTDAPLQAKKNPGELEARTRGGGRYAQYQLMAPTLHQKSL
jgi:hypothetical protein